MSKMRVRARPELFDALRVLLQQPDGKKRRKHIRQLETSMGISKALIQEHIRSLRDEGVMSPCVVCGDDLPGRRMDVHVHVHCRDGCARASLRAHATCLYCRNAPTFKGGACNDCYAKSQSRNLQRSAKRRSRKECPRCGAAVKTTILCATCLEKARSQYQQCADEGICYCCRGPIEKKRQRRGSGQCATCTRDQYARSGKWQGYWRHTCPRCGEEGHMEPTCPIGDDEDMTI